MEQLMLAPPRQVTFSVPLAPIGQGSMIMGKHGGIHHTQAGLTKYRDDIGLVAKSHMQGAKPWEKHIGVKLLLRFRIRPPHRTDYTQPTATAPGVFDVDKLIRAIADALQGVVYENDSQIIKVSAEKCWGHPGVDISVIELP